MRLPSRRATLSSNLPLNTHNTQPAPRGPTHVQPHLQRPPQTRQGACRHRRLRHALQGARQGGLRHGAILPARHARLRLRSAVLSRVHQAARPDRSGDRRSQRCQGARNAVSARSRPGRLQHRDHDPLARFQRHLARRGMGPSVRQSRRHPCRRRLVVAQCRRRRPQAVDGQRRPDRDDQGARDPGRDRAGKQLQPRRAGPRGAGQGRLHRRCR